MEGGQELEDAGKYKQLLEALLESSKEFLNSQELGELAGISQRTVIRYMKELKEQSLKYGFFIHTVKGRGYRLEIIEEEKFRDALAVEEDVEVTKVLFKLFSSGHVSWMILRNFCIIADQVCPEL